MTEYLEFLESKRIKSLPAGKEIDPSEIHPLLFPFQRDLTVWAIRKGQAAIFADTGLGKTLMQLEWARLIAEKTLIIAPLSVARQTVREAKKIDLDITYARNQGQVNGAIAITNYEMIDHFDFSQFGAVVLDESSILKAIGGKTRKKLTELCRDVPYRLCCTATPAPNDYTELGNHVEFLGICKASEMLAMFFINANKEHTFYIGGKAYRKKGSNKGGQEWRLKHHAEQSFFQWLSTWAIALIKPSDLEYSDEGFILPPLNLHPHFVRADYKPEDQLFFTHIRGVKNAADIRRETAPARLEVLKELVENGNSCYNIGHELSTQGGHDDVQQRISEAVLSEAPKGKARICQRANQRSDARTTRGTKGVHAPIQAMLSREMETHTGATSEGECSPTSTLCSGQATENKSPKTGKRLAEEKSPKAQSAAVEKVPIDDRGIPSTSRKTTSEVCDLRPLRNGQSEHLSLGGSLSCNRQSEGPALPKLQSWTGEVHGQSELAKSGGKIPGEQWVIWCGLNAEQKMIEDAFGSECVSVHGSLSFEEKLRRLDLWLSGEKRILISKPKVLGFGLNLQQAHKMAFFGLNYSWEQFYQCIRRQWRYMQEHPVDVHIIMSDIETSIYHNVMRKDAQARRLREGLIEQVKTYERGELQMIDTTETTYEEGIARGNGWTMMLGDSSVRLKELADDSIDLSVYSPPFADLYTYTDSERDLGNCRDWDEFFGHYKFIVREMLRVTKPGRVTCVHTSDIPALAQKDGYIGVKDFPGAVIKAYEGEGWVFHGRAFVQKNPQAQAIRTKSKALLFVQLAKDSAASRPALIDQILVFRKPGDNAVPITPVANGEMSNELWIEWAHGIWTGIRETETLQYSRARAADDEKHICPLQLETIERCIKLWSNPGEVVASPFAGIGSEIYQAIRFGREGIGIELKKSYFDVAVKNCRIAEMKERESAPLFAFANVEVG